jgi:hypothetical protein
MDKRQQGQLRVYIRNILPVLLLAFGWYNVYSLARNLEKNVIEIYQDAQLEVVRNAARAAVVYITHELERRGQDAIPEIEREVQREFVKPIRIGIDEEDAWMLGDAWIYAPDHIVFDESEDLPEEYWGMSMPEIFELQDEYGAWHYEEMSEAVVKGQEGIGWYVFWPDKAGEYAPWWEFLTHDSGREIAAWTPVEVFDNKWVIGMSAMLPRIMENSGAYLQIQNAIVQMLVVTVLVFGLLYFLNRAEVQVKELRQRVEILQIEIDEAKKASQVSEIIESEYFQNLAAHAKELRTRKKKGG